MLCKITFYFTTNSRITLAVFALSLD